MKQIYINELILKDLQNRYKKSTLSKKELSFELGISESSISTYIAKGCGLPNFIRVGGKTIFPIVNVVSYLSNTIKVS